ncbi:hypothetical protein JNUCC0626_47845 [Lentzea sp. JNUCC 0626]
MLIRAPGSSEYVPPDEMQAPLGTLGETNQMYLPPKSSHWVAA